MLFPKFCCPITKASKPFLCVMNLPPKPFLIFEDRMIGALVCALEEKSQGRKGVGPTLMTENDQSSQIGPNKVEFSLELWQKQV